MLLWVAAYPQGARLRLAPSRAEERRRLTAEVPGWILERLARLGVPEAPAVDRAVDRWPNTRFGPPLLVHGLVKVSQGTVCDVLSPWGQEARYLHDCLGRAVDAHSFSIEGVYQFAAGPEEVRMQHVQTKHGISSVPTASHRSLLFKPAEFAYGLADDLAVKRAGSDDCCAVKDVLGDVVDSSASLLCLMLPQQVLELVMRSAWKELLVLARFYIHARCGFPREGRLWRVDSMPTLLPGYPTLQWIRHALTDASLPTSAPAPLTSSALRSVALQLQQWAPRIAPASGGDPDEPGDDSPDEWRLRGCVGDLLAWADNLDRPAVELTRTGFQYTAAAMIHAFRVTRLLRRKMALKQVLERALDFLSPGLFSETLAKSSQTVPSKYTLWRAEFAIDLALIHMERRRNQVSADQPILRWAWADSSPQLGRNWLVLRHHRVSQDHLLPAWEAAMELALDRPIQEKLFTRAGRRAALSAKLGFDVDLALEDGIAVDMEHEEASSDDDAEDAAAARTPLGPERRQELGARLRAAISYHTHIPAALGKGTGFSDLASKVRAATHVFGVESSSVQDLSRYLRSFVSVTTDMGTELGMAEFRVESLDSVIPEWMRPPLPAVLEADLASGASDDADLRGGLEANQDSGADGHSTWMPNSLTVPGMCHILHNLACEVDLRLPHFDDFYKQLKNASGLLCDSQRRRQFVAFCLRRSRLAHLEPSFQCDVPALYEKRWGHVIAFIQRARPLLIVVRACWNPDVFGSGGQEASGGYSPFEPDALSATMRSNAFFGYMTMLLCLHGIVDHLAGFAEGCYCHEFMAPGRGRCVGQPVHENDSFSTCPMKGLRAPEFAAGRIDALVAYGARCLAQRLAEESALLSLDEWGEIVADYHQGVDLIKSILEVKIGFWRKLPWLLAGLAHHDEAQARQCASAALAHWSGTGDGGHQFHHPVSQKFLSAGGGLRQHLDAFVDGTPRADLPVDFRMAVAALAFTPVVERTIEAQHSYIKKRAGHNRSGPCSVSLSIRAEHVMEQTLRRDPGALKDLCAAFEDVRHVRHAVKILGFERHPAFEALSHSSQTSLWVSKFISALYTCDLDSQYADTSEAQKENRKRAEKHKRHAMRHAHLEHPVLEAPPLSADSIMARSMLDHIRDTCEEGAVFTMPGLDALSMPSLAAALAPRSRNRDDAVVHDQELDEAGLGAGGQVYLKVLIKHPSSMHTVSVSPVAGNKLAERTIIVTVHHGTAANAEARSSSAVISKPVKDPVAFTIPHDADHAALKHHAMRCATTGASRCTLSGFEPTAGLDALCEVVGELVAHHAFPASGRNWVLPAECGNAGAVLAEMLGAGLAECSPGAQGKVAHWSLTQAGVSRLSFLHRLAAPEPLFKVRARLQLEDASSFELLVMLRNAGWEWRRWNAACSQLGLEYRVGGPKIWYSSGTVVIRPYVRALLSAETLEQKSNVRSIPHGQVVEVYNKILKGESWAPRLRFQRRSRAGTQLVALQLDVEDAAEDAPHAQALCDGAVEQPSLAALLAEGSSGSEAGDAASQTGSPEGDVGDLSGTAGSLVGASVEAVEESAQQSGCTAIVPMRMISDGSDFDSRLPHGLDALPEARASSSSTRAQRDDLLDDSLLPGARLYITRHFGCFRITPKRPKVGDTNRFGGYEASCPFHAKSKRTGCKKFCPLAGPGPEDHAAVLLKLKWWCVQATEHAKQYEHVFGADLDHPPSEELVNSLVPEAGPTAVVDDHTHAEAMAMVASGVDGEEATAATPNADRPARRDSQGEPAATAAATAAAAATRRRRAAKPEPQAARAPPPAEGILPGRAKAKAAKRKAELPGAATAAAASSLGAPAADPGDPDDRPLCTLAPQLKRSRAARTRMAQPRAEAQRPAAAASSSRVRPDRPQATPKPAAGLASTSSSSSSSSSSASSSSSS